MNIRIALSTLSLAIITNFAVAQSNNDQKAAPPTGNTDSAQQKTQDINAQDHQSGNDLTAKKLDGSRVEDSDAQKSATIHAQDSKSGNNMLASKKGARSFDELDAGKTGAISMTQAKHDPWLSKNFKMCDSDHGGTVSRNEYEKCSQAM